MKNKTNVGSIPSVTACCLTEFPACAFVTEFVHHHFLTIISRTTLEILEREFARHLSLREIVICTANVRGRGKSVFRDVELISSQTIFKTKTDRFLFFLRYKHCV
jgi:hypothetical protein